MMLPARRFGRSLFDDMFRDSFFTDFFKGQDAAVMKTDIREQEGNYLLGIELPGYDKADIKVEIKDGYLTVIAEKNEENEEKDEKGNYIRRERYSGSCKRTFYVGENVKEEDIKASFKDGVLNLSVPKEDSPKIEDTKKYITIE